MTAIARVKDYLLAEEHIEHQRTCRVKKWAHDNAFTLYWLHLIEIVLLVVLILQ
ncbi:MAG: hypothetical protein M3540_10995 [Actinomycetota bacterium]|nr:hypothetical protein [Actinomycetota bacterium]